MYEVFFESSRIVITGNRHLYEGKAVFADREPALWDVFSGWIREGSQTDLLLVTDRPSATFRKFSTMFELIEAAGGIVFNPGGEWLFIYRKGKWDLPKGMIERNETKQVAAIREVSEECGISGLQPVRQLPPSHHLYLPENGQWTLKRTDWYLMWVPEPAALFPQRSEGIEEARWFRPEEFGEITSNTYPAVRILIDHLKQSGAF